MKKSFLSVIGAVALLFSISSCDKLPQEKVDAAYAAIDSIKAVDAELYAPQVLSQVQDSLNSALASIETQKSKMFANYDGVKSQLDAIVTLAAEAKVKVVEAKEAIKLEVEGVIAEVSATLNQTDELIKKAPRGKEGASALEAIKADVEGINNALAEAKDAFDKGVYVPTLDKVKAAKDKALAINNELTTAIEKKRK